MVYQALFSFSGVFPILNHPNGNRNHVICNVSGLIKFFGCVARLYPNEVCSQNESFVATLFNNLSSPENPSMLSLAVQTVGFIGTSIDGKMALVKLG